MCALLGAEQVIGPYRASQATRYAGGHDWSSFIPTPETYISTPILNISTQIQDISNPALL